MRKKNISIVAKRIAEQGDEYQRIKGSVWEGAREYNCHPNELQLREEYPEEIDW